jgi:hypothetical protein
MECASGLMLMTQPNFRAIWCQRQSQSSRQGWALISTATRNLNHIRSGAEADGRYGTDSKEVGSLLLGLYDEDGHLNHVGFTSGIAKADKPSLTKKLEKLIHEPGFTGKAPGAPSRWSTERSTQWKPLSPQIVVEVSFDHVTDDRFRHGTKLVRFRPDKSPRQCTMEQLHRSFHTWIHFPHPI